MQNLPSRREIVAAAVTLPLMAASPNAWAQAKSQDQSALARLRAAKTVTVGIANFPPYSGIDPDGTLTGVIPTIVKQIMARLGVPDVKGVSAGYGELIPGMQAGRWEFICAALTITKVRCGQVMYADPMVFDGASLLSLKGELSDPPKTIADLIARKLTVGSGAGGAYARYALDAGIDPAHLLQFPNEGALIDGLIAKRIQVVFQGNASISRAYRQRGLAVDVTYPISDFPVSGSGCAFPTSSTDLYGAFQQELRAMKASGEYLTIIRQYGLDTPAELIPMTADQACATST